MKDQRVLVVDDEKNITFVIKAILEKAGFQVETCNRSDEAYAALEKSEFSLVITDLYMPDVSGEAGFEILSYCKKMNPHLPVVMITAFGTVDSAVSALKQGAFDYITKPFDQTELLNVVTKAVRTYEAVREDQVTVRLIGESPEMQELFKLIGKIAKTHSTVLIQGESGTGKELVAYEVHRLSDRSGSAFIKVNCGAIPSNLIESELFGYEKGAFTGAVTSKPGRFELANEGTLFLDEVAEMSLEMQVKLLRAIQEQEFERVGGVSSIKVDARIIAATNRNLEKEVREGRFREDLFYRLNVLPIEVPALREHPEDIELLLKGMVPEKARRIGKKVVGIERSCLERMKSYDWPGNVRQLENAVERMILMCEGTMLSFGDLPEQIREYPKPRSDEAVVDFYGGEEELGRFKEIVRKRTQEVEKGLIEKALLETAGNVTRAADRLGISRKGLQIKLKELGLKSPR